MVMELLIIAPDPHMIPYFMANELWYALVFHICDFNYHASFVLRLKGQRSHNNCILMTFDLFKQLSHQAWLSKKQI